MKPYRHLRASGLRGPLETVAPAQKSWRWPSVEHRFVNAETSSRPSVAIATVQESFVTKTMSRSAGQLGRKALFDSPRQDEFTQGIIFSCATAENYGEQSVCGLVITARCDAAQDKAPIYNYIPVVSLTDWVLADGGQIALERAIGDCENGLKNILLQAGLSETLLKSKTPTEIHATHLAKKAEQDKKWLPKCSNFLELAKSLGEMRAAVDGDDRTEKRRLLPLSKKLVDAVVRELTGNRLLGYYLLRGVPNIHDETVGDYVALLREIHHIPNSLAKRIAKGLSKDDILGEPNIVCPRFVGEDDYSMPIARLKSPWIEHLMQSLTMVFARIGVEDVDFLNVKKSLVSLGLES